MGVVTNEGHVRWIPPLVVKTMCDMPNKATEVQTCELKFGSWVYTAQQLDLINRTDNMDLEGYNPALSGTWRAPVWRGTRLSTNVVPHPSWTSPTPSGSSQKINGYWDDD